MWKPTVSQHAVDGFLNVPQTGCAERSRGGRSTPGRLLAGVCGTEKGRNRRMSVKRLALLALTAVGALAATASPAFALSATADTNAWEANGKVRAFALSGNTLYVGGKFGLLRAQGGTPKIK